MKTGIKLPALITLIAFLLVAFNWQTIKKTLSGDQSTQTAQEHKKE